MNNDSLLTIRQIVGRGPIIRKRAMRLPILSVQGISSSRERSKKLRTSEGGKPKERRSPNQLLNIIQSPHPQTNYFLQPKKKANATDWDSSIHQQKSIPMKHKRVSSVPNEPINGQIELVMQRILKREKAKMQKKIKEHGNDSVAETERMAALRHSMKTL
jgi:hypothetical protein